MLTEAGDLALEGNFYRTLWHEVGHYLGPDQTQSGGDIDAALQDTADLFEEMKAGVAEAAASFVAFVTSTTGGLAAAGDGWEEPGATRGEEAKMMADSLSVWMSRWREDVRGRGL